MLVDVLDGRAEGHLKARIAEVDTADAGPGVATDLRTPDDVTLIDRRILVPDIDAEPGVADAIELDMVAARGNAESVVYEGTGIIQQGIRVGPVVSSSEAHVVLVALEE